MAGLPLLSHNQRMALSGTNVVRDANPGADSLRYRGLLKEIDNGIGERDMDKLKYLCLDLGVPLRTFEGMKRGIHLFVELEKLALITPDDISLLVALMQAVNRFDLAKKLKAWSSRDGSLAHQLSTYRKLMLRISDSLTRDERDQLNFYLSGNDILSVSAIEESKTVLQLFLLMEKHALIGPDDVDYLIRVMDAIGNLAIVKEIQKYRASLSSSSSTHNMQQSASQSVDPLQSGMAYNTGYTRCKSEPIFDQNQATGTVPYHRVTSQPQLSDIPQQQYYQLQQQQPQYQPEHHQQMLQYQHQQQQKEQVRHVQSAQPLTPPQVAATTSNLGSMDRPAWYKTACQERGVAYADSLWEFVRTDAIQQKMQNLKLSQEKAIRESTSSIKTEYREDQEESQGTGEVREAQTRGERELSNTQLTGNNPSTQGHQIVPAQTAIIARQPPKDTRPALPTYSMNRLPRGLCIIFNAKNFQQTDGHASLGKRDGTDKDVEGLLNTFGNRLKYSTYVKTDPTSSDYLHCLKELQNMDHSRYDSFVCIILSHGSKGCVYGTDGKKVAIDDLTGMFRGAYTPSLAGKPKLFFIQACQGQAGQAAIDVQQDATNTVPNEADTLVSLSTVPGYASNRSVTKGSWYISTLCYILNKHYKSVDLLSMLTLVNHALSEAADKLNEKQIGHPSHTLRKQIYFDIQGPGE